MSTSTVLAIDLVAGDSTILVGNVRADVLSIEPCYGPGGHSLDLYGAHVLVKLPNGLLSTLTLDAGAQVEEVWS